MVTKANKADNAVTIGTNPHVIQNRENFFDVFLNKFLFPSLLQEEQHVEAVPTFCTVHNTEQQYRRQSKLSFVANRNRKMNCMLQ